MDDAEQVGPWSGDASGVVGRSRRATARQADLALWKDVAATQAGVITRSQLLALGMTFGAVAAQLDSGRWTGLHPGVYAVFTGPVPPLARAWAAVLAAGDDAALGGRTTLWLWNVLDLPESVLTLCVPERRRIVAPGGTRVLRRRRLPQQVHPVALPRRLRVEEAVLDVTDEAGGEGDVIDLVLRATSSRRTTPDRLREALGRRRQHRHRPLLDELLAEAADGVQSPLERRYRRGVERAHGLPRAERNVAERVVGRSGAARNRYRDVVYRRWRVVVELDGYEAHPAWRRRHDRARDNSATVAGDQVLTYGWYETVTEPCQVAVEVIRLLWRQGWRGTPRPCCGTCPVADLIAPR